MCQARAETRAGKALTPRSTLTLALALAQALAQASQALAVCEARAKTRAGMALTPCLPLALALALALALCLDTAEMAAKTKETGRQRPSRSPMVSWSRSAPLATSLANVSPSRESLGGEGARAARPSPNSNTSSLARAADLLRCRPEGAAVELKDGAKTG